MIDLDSKTLHVMVYTRDADALAYRLHALDLGSLKDKVTPQLVTASHIRSRSWSQSEAAELI